MTGSGHKVEIIDPLNIYLKKILPDITHSNSRYTAHRMSTLMQNATLLFIITSQIYPSYSNKSKTEKGKKKRFLILIQCNYLDLHLVI